MRLTQAAHQAIAQVLRTGQQAVDATVGNGYDTLFLARQVGPSGHVHGFDIQPEAIEETHRRLKAANLNDHVSLHLKSHEFLSTSLSSPPSAIVFNLGYLPGGDHALTSSPETTRSALKQALELLLSGGVLSVMAYPDHPGGAEEAAVVHSILTAETRGHLSISGRKNQRGPLLYLFKKD